MTKLLTEVIRQIVELPEERQDDAARVLMLMLEHDPEQYRLSDEQLREVDEAISDVDAGNFASDQDIDRVLHRSWAWSTHHVAGPSAVGKPSDSDDRRTERD